MDEERTPMLGATRLLQGLSKRALVVLSVVLVGLSGACQMFASDDQSDTSPGGSGAQGQPGDSESPSESPGSGIDLGEAELPEDHPIKHIVYIVKENRTYDNYFARYPRGEGTRTGKTSDGRTVELTVAPDVQEPDLGHSFFDGVIGINGGKMDGFDKVSNGEDLSGYNSFTRKGMPNYWAYADNFVLGDHHFSSMYGPTFPEHLYTVGGQAADVVGNKLQVNSPGGYCDDPGETVYRFAKMSKKEQKQVMRAEERADVDRISDFWEEVRACFDFEVIQDQLNQEDISWHYYADEGSWMNAMLAIKHMRFSEHWGRDITRGRTVHDRHQVRQTRGGEHGWCPGPGSTSIRGDRACAWARTGPSSTSTPSCEVEVLEQHRRSSWTGMTSAASTITSRRRTRITWALARAYPSWSSRRGPRKEWSTTP